MKKKDASEFLKQTSYVINGADAQLIVNGEKVDATPFVEGAMFGVSYAAMLLDGDCDVESNDPRRAASKIISAAISYHYNGKGE